MGKHEVETAPSSQSSPSMETRTRSRRAVFLDRDGVINRAVIRNGLPHPPFRVEEFELYDDVAAGCARLKAADFVLVVITNQPDVGRGQLTREAVEAMHLKMQSTLPFLDRIEACYHAGERYGERCDCRKPRPGMILRAAAELKIDLGASYVIGDRWRDIDCARAAGCRAIFIQRDYQESLRKPPDFTVLNFSDAVNALLRDADVP
jgi:D-glycero-D-manno-heptose 1,7-bisphosphate phosphatase